MAVRRSPTDPLPMTKEALVDSLLDDGLGLQSANRLRIEFEFVDNELVERIQSLYFFYRPVERTETDVPILYLDAECWSDSSRPSFTTATKCTRPAS